MIRTNNVHFGGVDIYRDAFYHRSRCGVLSWSSFCGFVWGASASTHMFVRVECAYRAKQFFATSPHLTSHQAAGHPGVCFQCSHTPALSRWKNSVRPRVLPSFEATCDKCGPEIAPRRLPPEWWCPAVALEAEAAMSRGAAAKWAWATAPWRWMPSSPMQCDLRGPILSCWPAQVPTSEPQTRTTASLTLPH